LVIYARGGFFCAFAGHDAWLRFARRQMQDGHERLPHKRAEQRPPNKPQRQN